MSGGGGSCGGGHAYGGAGSTYMRGATKAVADERGLQELAAEYGPYLPIGCIGKIFPGKASNAMTVPTTGETFAILIEHLRKAQESAAMMAHLVRDDDRLKAQGWLAVSEMLKKTAHTVTKLATRGMH